jgi:UDP-N-acetylmuramate dehydrogenase
MIDLAPLHSFALSYQASALHSFTSIGALQQAATEQGLFNQPHLVLGGGTNTIFTSDFAGTIIRLTNQELSLDEDDDFYYLSVDAGFEWHQLVCWALDNGVNGLENLALIPGTVGAAPIQNIGAYGVQFEEVCDFVEYLGKESLQIKRLSQSELEFAYRDSIFKHDLKDKCVITKVGLKLKKRWQAILSYGPLSTMKAELAAEPDVKCQARRVFDRVIAIRQSKLPNPLKVPNAGSFFKNPMTDNVLADWLSKEFAGAPLFVVDQDSQKIPAAWIIEQCGLKGHCIGGVAIYEKHALVLINKHQGTGGQLLELVTLIRDTVKRKFAVTLELEVRLMGNDGELSVK